MGGARAVTWHASIFVLLAISDCGSVAKSAVNQTKSSVVEKALVAQHVVSGKSVVVKTAVQKHTHVEAAPVPENINTVHHQKDKGSGYREGSPLYEKQEAAKVDAPVVAELDNAPVAALEAAPEVTSEAPLFLHRWVWVVTICIIVGQILLAGGCFYFHQRYRRKNAPPLYEPRGNVQVLGRAPGTMQSMPPQTMPPMSQGIVVGLPTPGMRVGGPPPVMRSNSVDGSPQRGRSPHDVGFAMHSVPVSYSTRDLSQGPGGNSPGGQLPQPVQGPMDPNAVAYQQRSWHMPGSWAGGPRG